MQPGKPVLLICHFFPPVPDIGGRRWAKFAKELARRGHPVHVIRREKRKYESDSLWTMDVQHPLVHQYSIKARHPGILSRWPLTKLHEKIGYRFWLKALALLTKGNYYDVGFLSQKELSRLAFRLIKEHGIRNVIATGAPFSQLVFAARFKQRIPQLHVVADFRDEWTWSGHYGLASLSAKRVAAEKWKEQFVMERADKFISPHQRVIDHLAITYPTRRDACMVVPNIIDPDDFDTSEPGPNSNHFRIIYAGSLYGADEAEKYFDQLLLAFERLKATAPEHFPRCSVDFYITSQGVGPLQAKVAAKGLQDTIRFNAPLPPRELSKEIRRSDLVLVFIPSFNKDILGTKFHEIFYLQRPILHVGEKGRVSQVLEERKLGASISVEALPGELPKFITGERQIELDPSPDLGDVLLAPVTDKLIRDVLV